MTGDASLASATTYEIYGYDALGRLASVTEARLNGHDQQDPAGVYCYDATGQEVAAEGPTVFYAYDPVGNLQTVTQPNGVTEDYDYDSLNRLYHVYVHNGDDAIFEQTYVIASDGQRDSVIEKRYDGSGHAAGDVLSKVKITWDYDADGRLVAETRDADTTLGDGNDDFGDRDTANGTSVIVADYTDFFTLDLVGNRRRLLHGWNADGDGLADAGEVDSDTLYLYNSRDQLLSEDSLEASLGSATATVNGQTVTITVSNTLAAGDFVSVEGYDGVFAVQSPTSSSFTISRGNINITPGAVVVHKVLATTTYAYDANSSQTSVATPAGTTHYLWDLRGRMVGIDLNGDGDASDAGGAGVGETEYGYDANGVRVSEVTHGSSADEAAVFVNDDANPTGYSTILERRTGTSIASATLDTTYTIGLRVEGQDDPQGQVWFVRDGHGSNRALVDDAGAVLEAYDYQAFGQLIEAFASGPRTIHLFGGDGVYDGATGWTYHLARWRSDFRFVSYDSFEADPASPAGLHKYLYANANPISNSDPSGHLSITELTVGGGIIGGLIGFGHGAILGYRDGGWKGALYRGFVEGALGAVLGAGAGAAIGYGGVGLAYLARSLGLFLPPSTAIYSLATAAGISGAYEGYSEMRNAKDPYEVFAGMFTLVASIIGVRFAGQAALRSAPDAWIPWETRTMYRGTTAYDALETVQEAKLNLKRIAARQAGDSKLDLGPGIYMTDSLSTATEFAQGSGAVAGPAQGGPGIIVIEISNGKWWWLKARYGAVERVPITDMDGATQNFVPPKGGEALNRYAIFSLGTGEGK